MNDTSNKNKPIESFRDGAIQVAIWPRTGPNGIFYEIERSRSYKDKNDEWQKTTLISERDMLKARYLEEQAYASIQRLKDQDRALQSYQKENGENNRQNQDRSQGLAEQRDQAIGQEPAQEPAHNHPEPTMDR